MKAQRYTHPSRHMVTISCIHAGYQNAVRSSLHG
jgi:hypothetical protein